MSTSAVERSRPGRLDGKVALVTGAGQGIGEAIARLFAAEGARVALSARSEDKLRRVADQIAQAGGIAHPIPADISAVEGIESLVGSVLELSLVGTLPWGLLSYRARGKLDALPEHRCHLTWSSALEMPQAGIEADQIVKLLQKSYAKMFLGIKRRVET